MDEMIDAKVSLTTTEYAFVTKDGDNSIEIDLILQNAPVVVVEAAMNLPSNCLELQKAIHQSLMTGIDKVVINSNLRTIFIGEDPNIEETGLVIYQDLNDTPHVNDFFRRWDEIHTFLFEYSLRQRIEPFGLIACVSGIRTGNVWTMLGIVDKPMLQIKEEA